MVFTLAHGPMHVTATAETSCGCRTVWNAVEHFVACTILTEPQLTGPTSTSQSTAITVPRRSFAAFRSRWPADTLATNAPPVDRIREKLRAARAAEERLPRK
jgi:hypothetical protein